MRLLLRLLLLGPLSACGATASDAFDPHFPASDADSAQLPSLPVAPEAPLQLAAIRAGQQADLLLYDAADGRAITADDLRPQLRPQLLANLALTVQDGKLIARERRDGSPRFSVPLPHPLFVGAARLDDRIFLASAEPRFNGPKVGSSLTAIDALSGRVLWQRSLDGRVGKPTVFGRRLYVPWNFQHLSRLDPNSGRELERLQRPEAVVRWLQVHAGRLFVGDRAAHLLGRKTDGLSLDSSNLPGRPALHPGAYAGEGTAGSAEERIGLRYRLQLNERGEVRFAGERVYLFFYRHLFALRPDGQLLWARAFDADLLDARVAEAGLWVIRQDGQLALLDGDNGALRAQHALQTPLQSARLNGGALGVLPTAAGKAQDLRSALTEIALDTDARMVPSRMFAVRRLSAMATPDVTRDLLDIYGQSSTPPILKRLIAASLRQRNLGEEFLIDALRRRYDYLDQTRSAPLDVIIPALVEQQVKRALPLLVARLTDHELDTEQLTLVAQAINRMGDHSVVPALRRLLYSYRADTSFAADPGALLQAAEALGRLGGPDAEALLTHIAAQQDTLPPLAEAIRALLGQPDVATQPGVTEPAPAPAETPGLADSLGQPAINRAFARRVSALRTCVLKELDRNPHLAQLRIAFVAQPDGQPRALSVAPGSDTLQQCVMPLLRGLRFAPFNGPRHLAAYVIAVRPFRRTLLAHAPLPTGPWWGPQRPADAMLKPAEGEPWWAAGDGIVQLGRAPASTTAAKPEAAVPGAAVPEAPAAPAAPPARPTHPSKPTTEQTADPDAASTPAMDAPQPAAGDAWWLPTE